jgi:hypothetical protein
MRMVMVRVIVLRPAEIEKEKASESTPRGPLGTLEVFKSRMSRAVE